MAAAGLGNTLSDCVGLFTGDYIEAWCYRAGIREPKLSEEQARSREARWCKSAGSLLGLAFGCLLGMAPLLWQSDRKGLYFSPDEEKLYEVLFRPHGVSLTSFFALMKECQWRRLQKGDQLVAAGEPLSEVIMLVSGFAVATSPNEPCLLYLSHSANTDDVAKDFSDAPLRGCFLGVAGLLDQRTSELPFPHEVHAATEELVCVAWDRERLHGLIEQDAASKCAMLSIVYAELVHAARRSATAVPAPRAARARDGWSMTWLFGGGGSQDGGASSPKTAMTDARDTSLKAYKLSLETVIVDGIVHPAERKFCDDFRKRRGITAKDHTMILEELGWSEQDWARGSQSGQHTAVHGVEHMCAQISDLLSAAPKPW